MALIVQKFGGSSLQSAEDLLCAAARMTDAYDRGNQVIAVLSARGDTTDRLLAEARALNPAPPPRETDLLLSVGEQIAVCHMAMLLQKQGYDAAALTGWQAGIQTDPNYGSARVQNVDGARIRAALARGQIVLVTGFQGLSADGEVTTLGRGGSDTTAVALAAHLRADVCRIFTDVDGVYSADPRRIKQAKKWDAVSYDDMLEMANCGAKVLHSRCVELAKEFSLPFEVCSTKSDVPGTRVQAGAPRPFCGVCSAPDGEDGTQAWVSLVGAQCAAAQRACLQAVHGLPVLAQRASARACSLLMPAEAAPAAMERLHRQFFVQELPEFS